MAISAAFKRLLGAGVWASAPSAARTDPDDASLATPITPRVGYPASFSATDGDTPYRAVENELRYRDESALFDVANFGLLPWDADLNYLAANTPIVQRQGRVFRGVADSGPDNSGAVDPLTPSQSAWVEVTGTLSTPAAPPSAPQATSPSSGELDWFWHCPLDGGARVTQFGFQWRQAGTTSWSVEQVVTTPRAVVTGLTNGQAYEAQVRARNSEGWGPFSAVGNATPAGMVPAGGSQLALRATAGNGQVVLDWLEPDDGGVDITGYTIQWRTAGQAFSSGRQATATERTWTRAFANGTEVFFQVRAVNNEGAGAWSNEASGTPVAPPPPPPMPPPDEAPAAPGAPVGVARRPLRVTWAWNAPDQNGQPILRFEFQWRLAGEAWGARGTETLTRGSFSHVVPGTASAVQARVRAVNSVGTGGWSSDGEVAASELLGEVPQRHRFTSSQTFNWPYADISEAALVNVGREGLVRNSARDIDISGVIPDPYRAAIGANNDTLYRVDGHTLRGYNLATLAADSSRDVTITGILNGLVINSLCVFDSWALAHCTWTGNSQPYRTYYVDLGTGVATSLIIRSADSAYPRAVTNGIDSIWVHNTRHGIWYGYDLDLSGNTPSAAVNTAKNWYDHVSGASGDTAANGSLMVILTATVSGSTASASLFAYNNDLTEGRFLFPRQRTTGDNWWGVAVNDSELWINNEQTDKFEAYTLPTVSRATLGGTTYENGSHQLSGLSAGDTFTIAPGAGGTIDLYPQFAAT